MRTEPMVCVGADGGLNHFDVSNGMTPAIINMGMQCR